MNATLAAAFLSIGLAMAQAPIPLGFEDGELGRLPADWSLTTPRGFRAGLSDAQAAIGKRSLHIERRQGAPASEREETGVVLHWRFAAPLRGRRVVLRSQLKVAGAGHAKMWLRVDRGNQQTGAFDNMDDRPVRAGEWQPVTIEVDVAEDAKRIFIGFSVSGEASVWADDMQLTVALPTSATAMTPRELDNAIAATRLFGYLRFFHPSREAVRLKRWDHFAVALIAAALPATTAEELATRLTTAIAKIAPTVQLWAAAQGVAPPLLPPLADATSLWSWQHRGAGRVAATESMYRSTVKKQSLTESLPAAEYEAAHAVFDLGGGIAARVPFRVLVGPSRATAEDAAATAPEAKPTAADRDTRLASIAVAWTVFEHFYPYFEVVDVDWSAALREALTRAANDTGAEELGVTLSCMVARLGDGHGYVRGRITTMPSSLPVSVGFAGPELVVTGRANDDVDVRIGDVILAIDDRPVADIYRELSSQISAATEGYRRSRAKDLFPRHVRTADPVRLTLRHGDAVRTVSLARVPGYVAPQLPPRPGNSSALADGIVYFDLCGAEEKAVTAALPTLVAAKAVVFDLRGYPGSGGVTILRHLIQDKGTSARWQVPLVTTPFRRDWQWDESGRWQLQPKEPRIAGKIAFLTDGGAISYAESVMGIVEAYKLGAIVGATTAGTNGNVNPFDLPSGHSVSWTGMRVLKHDGSRHHGVGIAPTLAVEPTAAGIAAGRDEVLQAAVVELQRQLGESK